MSNDAFRTFHDSNYLTNNYLYHYSRFETATKIIYYNNLRFSNIYNLNDTTESKPKIQFYSDNPINAEILERCQEINRHIKICCFTQDNTSIKRFNNKNDLYYTDYCGRGFALPRMWAQYASDNKGVCFIFNKDKLETALNNSFKLIGAEPIKYVERYTCFSFRTRQIKDFKTQVLSRTTTDSVVIEKFMETYPEYIHINYFTKLSDWRDEHEYRIALLSPHGENLSIDHLTNFLEGIIIGENVDEVEEAIIQKLLKRKVPIKKILFQHRSITLN